MDRALYALAWSVFAVGFAAVFWLQARSIALSSILAVARVVIPAALLGIAVVRLSERVPLQGARNVAIHGVATLAYPALWIGAVNVLNNLVVATTGGANRWRLPPPHVVHWHYLAGVMIYVALAALTFGRSHALEAEQKRLWAEWRALRGQLNPHFLFNTLHTVFGLAQLDPAAGEVAVTRFSRMLRHALMVHREDRDLVPLREEWSFTEDYLHLEALRLDGRLAWQVDIAADASDALIPALLLQPLVENSVRHGGVADRDRITITVTVRRAGAFLQIRISDDGCGSIPDAALGSAGVGLRAARLRVQRLTSRPDAFTIDTEPGAGFVVTLHLPVTPVSVPTIAAAVMQ